MKHDESTDVKRLSFVGVRTASEPSARGTVKCLVITPELRTRIGIKQWGRVDYLTNYCGYRVIKTVTSTATVVGKAKNFNNDNDTNKKSARQAKKEKKAPKLTNKKKK